MTRRTRKPKSVDPIWRDFIQWCAKRRLRSLPAHPWTMAAYLRWRAEALDHLDAEAVVKGLAKAHKLANKRSPHREPVVERTVSLIRNKRDAKDAGSDLFDADSLLFKADTPPPEAVADTPEETGKPGARGRKLSSTPRLVSRRPG